MSVSISREDTVEETSESMYEEGRESFLRGDAMLSLPPLVLWAGLLVMLLLALCRVGTLLVVRLLPCAPRSLDDGYTH